MRGCSILKFDNEKFLMNGPFIKNFSLSNFCAIQYSYIQVCCYNDINLIPVTDSVLLFCFTIMLKFIAACMYVVTSGIGQYNDGSLVD